MNIPYVFKKCTKCGEIKLATSDNFNKDKKGKYGLRSQCKICIKKYREDNKDEINKKRKEYRENNKDKIKKQSKKYREKNRDKIKEYKKEYDKTHKDKIKEYKEKNRDKIKEYRENNKDKIKEYQKEYYIDNKDKIKKQIKEYKEKNRDKIRQREREYRLSEKGKQIAFNSQSKRRFKEENQGNGITEEQWLEMMKFFNWKCAYSGEYIGGNSKERTIDHIIPLNKGGEHEVWNCVPMLRSLNCRKQDKDMLSWYKGQSFYNKWRLNKIQKWQEYAHDKWGK